MSLQWTESQVDDVRKQLSRMFASPVFSQADRQTRFLRYVVDETLADRGGKLNQYTIAIEVFDRDEKFDPAIDAIVRVEAARLRAKLREYYPADGKNDPVLIDMPKGSYAVKIDFGGPTLSGALDEQDATPTNLADTPGIAVLPFDNLSSDPDQEYFADGITEDLITDLSRLSGLPVIARHSVFTYKNAPAKVQQIGRDLQVRYLLEGSVQKSGDRVRITTQLIDSESGDHLWVERYDRKLDDIFAVQDDVVRQIVQSLEVKLSGSEHTYLSRMGRRNVEAYDFLLRGQEKFWMFTRENNAEARQLFSCAINVDPGYSDAHAWLAHPRDENHLQMPARQPLSHRYRRLPGSCRLPSFALI